MKYKDKMEKKAPEGTSSDSEPDSDVNEGSPGDIDLKSHDGDFALDSINTVSHLEVDNAVEGKPYSSNNVSQDKLDWPQQDLLELLKRMDMTLPENDRLSYGTRLEKFNWAEVTFNSYSSEQCKITWGLLQKKIRKYRVLKELLEDANTFVSSGFGKQNVYEDMPKRPLSAFMLFYLKVKDKILAKNPGLKLPELSKKVGIKYKNMIPARREKYLQMAAAERKNYEQKMDEFYQNHPEVPHTSGSAAPRTKVVIVPGPKKPQTAFGLYFEHQLKSFDNENNNRLAYKQQCTETYKQLSDKKKLIWIEQALDNESKYQEELKKYLLQNPSFKPGAIKPVITKEEEQIRDRLAGKPTKPPNSAYGLFTRMMLQSEDIKKIEMRYRIKAIADQWKTCTEEEKNRFKENAVYMQEQYKKDYENYLDTLSESKRNQEIANNTAKRKISPTDSNSKSKASKKTKKKEDPEDQVVPPVLPENQNNHTATAVEPKPKKNKKPKTYYDEEQVKMGKEQDFLKIFALEPQVPPVSGFELFRSRYHGWEDVELAWNALNKQDRKDYNAEVKIIKESYIKDYEKFLRSLTKEQLTAYSLHKKNK